jgi:hypothetical protein
MFSIAFAIIGGITLCVLAAYGIGNLLLAIAPVRFGGMFQPKPSVRCTTCGRTPERHKITCICTNFQRVDGHGYRV